MLFQKNKPLSNKEKWTLGLLLAILLVVIFLPMDSMLLQEEEENNEVLEGTLKMSEGSEDYGELIERELEEILSMMEGVGQVSVQVQISESEEKILYQEENTQSTELEEQDSVGGLRIEETKNIESKVLTDQSGEPFVTKVLSPKIEGVLVIAEGGDQSEIKNDIMEAIMVLFDLDAHKIKVAKRKVEDEY